MADFTDRIKLIIDVTSDKASKGISDIKSSAGEAEGVFGKLKAGAGSAFDAIGIAGPQAAVAAAGAIVAFGVKSIGAFTELANAAESFSQTSGASIEDASRWIEVSGDLGVSADAVSAAMLRLNREAATGKLAEFGVSTGDVNERLISTVEHINAIPNAADRAKAQFEVFGKSGAALAPLMANVDTLRDRLKDVEAAKIIDDKKLADARAFQDAMDNLHDKLDDIQNIVGGELVGAFTDLFTALDQVTSVIPGFDGLSDAIGKVGEIAFGPLRNIADGIATVTDSSSSLTDKARGLGQAVAGAIPGPFGSWAGNLLDVEDKQTKMKEATDAAAKSAQEEADAAKAAADALDGLLTATLAQFNGQLALEDAATKTTDSIAKYATAADTATQSNWGNKDSNDKAAAAMNDAEGAALKQAAAAAKLGEDNAKLSGSQWGAAESAHAQASVLETLAGTLAPGDPLRKHLLEYAAQLEAVPGNVTTVVTADTSQAQEELDAFLVQKRTIAIQAYIQESGGSVYRPPAGSSTQSAPSALGASPMAVAAPRASAAPTTVVNVNVAVAPLTHPAEVGRQIANYLDAFYRRNGTRLRAVP
jgi:hypothetical protein